MLIEAPLTKENVVEGGRRGRRTEVLREPGGGGRLTCHARALKFSRKLWRYKKFTEKISALRCDF